MGKLLGLLLVLLLIGGVAELVAPPLVESRIEETVQANTEQTVSVRAETRSFPLLTRVATDAEIEQLRISVDDVAGLDLPLGEVQLQLDRVRIDRGALLQGRVAVLDIGEGVLTGEITGDGISDALGVPVTIDAGTVWVELAGRRVEVPVQVSDGQLRLEVAGLGDFSWPIELDLMPCTPDAAAEDQRVVLTCRFQEVPEVVIEALGEPEG